MDKTTATLPVGVIVERRKIHNRWQEHAWRVAAVAPGMAPPADGWRALTDDGALATWHAATLTLALHRSETEGYKVNLSNRAPAVYVVSRRDADDPDAPPIAPFLATVCPFEAASYAHGGDDLVDAAAMPEAIRAWVAAYCETHHVDEVFVKRQRKPYDPRKGGFARAGRARGDA